MVLENLDLADRKIISALDKNSRSSYSELGKKLRMAKETVKYRIDQLQKKGIIKGFYTVINFSKIGFTLYRLYLRLERISQQSEKELTEYLLGSKNVVVFYRINGPYHMALGIWARNNWEFEKFWRAFQGKFGEYLAASHLSPMTEYLEFSRSYLLPPKDEEKKVFVTVEEAQPGRLDDIDLRLLAFLSNNARATLVEMAKKLGISVVTARYRLKRLMDNRVIVGFRSIFDLARLGREYYKVDLWFSRFERAKEVTRHILSHLNVCYTERTLITADLEFDVEVENFEKFTEMMESFRAKFPLEIRDYSYYSLVRNFKTSYAPSL